MVGATASVVPQDLALDPIMSIEYPPVRPLIVTSTFKSASRPTHQGIDLGCKRRQVLYAVAAGVIEESRESLSNPPDARPGSKPPPSWPRGAKYPLAMGWGNTVVIRCDDGDRVRYAHLDERCVRVGESVIRGQVIGYAGNTGYSSGAHLHFEVVRGGVRIDPLPLLAPLHPTIV